MLFKDPTETPEQRQVRLAAFFESRRPVREAMDANRATCARAREIFLEDGELGIDPGIRLAAYNARVRAAMERMTAALRAHQGAK